MLNCLVIKFGLFNFDKLNSFYLFKMMFYSVIGYYQKSFFYCNLIKGLYMIKRIFGYNKLIIKLFEFMLDIFVNLQMGCYLI